MKLRTTLERHIKESGITASTLAEKAGIPKATLLGWLAGKAPRDLNQLRSLAQFIGTTIEDLLFDDGPDSVSITQILPGFTRDEDGWHRGMVEIRFRHIANKNKKS